MKIPVEFVLLLTRRVTEHTLDGDLYGTPADSAYVCGRAARAWLAQRGQAEYQEVYDEAALVAWSERFGKHLSVFFSNERSH